MRRLPPFHPNAGKRIVKSPKVYVRDSGIVHSLLGILDYNALSGHPVVGSTWEGFVIENLVAAVADRQGNAPESPEIWGWRRNPTGPGLVPQGSRIGWVIESDLFLEPTASYQIAQIVSGRQRLPTSRQTLYRKMRESGLLASVDHGRQMLQVRRTLEGKPRQVLHLKATDLAVESQEVSGAKQNLKI